MSSNGKLPKGWQKKRLDEVTDIRFSSVDKHVVADEVPVRLCNYMEVWKNPYIHGGLNFMEGTATPAEVERFTVEPNDVLLTKDSETKEEIAEPSLVHEKIDNLVLGYHLALLRPDESQAHGPFLAAQLRIPEFRAQFVRAASGVTRYGLSLGAVGSAEVWLPPTTVQRRIADILWSCHDAIELTREVIDQTRKLKSAMLADLLTNGLPGHHKKYAKHAKVGRYPADWQLVPLDDLIEDGRPICYGILMPGRGYPGGVPVVKVKDIRGGQIDESDILLTSPDLDEEYRRSRLRTGDLLMTIRGSTGRVAIVPATLDRANITQDTARLSVADYVTRDYLYYALQGHALQLLIQHHTIGQAVKGINIEEVRKLLIPLPAEAERTQIVELFHCLEDRLSSEHDLLARLLATKSALSQALLTGRAPVAAKGGE